MVKQSDKAATVLNTTSFTLRLIAEYCALGLLKNIRLFKALPTIGWVSTYESLPHTTTTKITISQGEIQEISLRERVYVCHTCQHIQDRDLNAAKNLAKYARQALPCLDVKG
ncbi:MAG: zinc ribbon domain-containing protein [Nostoc sp.]|uniref:zinc ribbon domain-containing protein n=1 Tax=Nostoc sp. TaxID=1180 RepID=UPI002FFC9FA6